MQSNARTPFGFLSLLLVFALVPAAQAQTADDFDVIAMESVSSAIDCAVEPLTCNVVDEENVVDANVTNAATVNLSAGLGLVDEGTVDVAAEFGDVQPGGATTGFVIEYDTDLLDVEFDEVVSLATLDAGGNVVETTDGSPNALLDVQATVLNGSTRALVQFETTQDFRFVQITFTSLIDVLAEYDVFFGLANTDRAEVTPTVRFAAGSVTVGEDSGTATIDVSISNPGSNASTSVDVAFDASQSSASPGDVGGFGSETVTFPAGSEDGATQSVTVPITDDGVNESDETANFDLSGAMNAVLGAPSSLDLSINDNDGGAARGKLCSSRPRALRSAKVRAQPRSRYRSPTPMMRNRA